MPAAAMLEAPAELPVAQERDAAGVDEDFANEPLPVEHLMTLGVNAADLKKARDAGFCTVDSIVNAMRRDLINVRGLSENKAEKIVDAAKKCTSSAGASFLTATEFQARYHANILRIGTGCEAFNEMLGGGIETRSITELYGEFRTGKTQLCHTLAVTCQLPCDAGGAEGMAVIVDTEGTFKPERLAPIAERFSLDPEGVISNVMITRPYNSEQFMERIEALTALLNVNPVRLILVDSIMALYRADFQGRGQLAERQMKLNAVLSRLKKVAEEFGVAVLLTNQVMAVPDAMAMVNYPKAVGGHILAHASTTRIFMRKGRGDNRVAKLEFAPMLPPGECTFTIQAGGIFEGTD